ncbi:MAG: hypothetical protein Greene041619_1104 [Candidatus Peregrinibacteria bacterium Greene0416_19]|nr:MAG: hypothetical protein Greene041619_1104 [Candidatus Peregrinibacteria bacterium Greene0416_19]
MSSMQSFLLRKTQEMQGTTLLIGGRKKPIQKGAVS